MNTSGVTVLPGGGTVPQEQSGGGGKGAVIALLLVGLLALGVGGFVLTRKPSGPQGPTNDPRAAAAALGSAWYHEVAIGEDEPRLGA